MLGSRKNEGKNKIPCRLLNLMTNLDSVPFEFELVTIYVNVQVKVFILVPFPIDEKTALWITFAKLGLEHLDSLSEGYWL
jgi:hypothetical protein